MTQEQTEPYSHGIVGDKDCPHDAVVFYKGIEGLYSVCRACGWHVWDVVIPEDAEVRDLLTPDDPECDLCGNPIDENTVWASVHADCFDELYTALKNLVAESSPENINAAIAALAKARGGE